PGRALVLTGLIAGAGLVLGGLRAMEFSVAEVAGYQVVRRARMVMYGHLQRMTPAQLRGRARGGLLLRLTGDLSMLRMWLSRGVLIGTSSAIVLLTGIVAAVWLDLAMGVVLVAMLCLGAVASLAFGAPMREATRTMRRRRSLVMGNIDEQINALEVVQMAGRSRGEYSRLSRQNDALMSALVRIAWLRGWLRGLAMGSGLLATAAVLAVGMVEVYAGRTTIAVVVAEIAVSRFLTRPVRSLGLAHDYWHRGQVSRQKIVEFLGSSARPAQAERLPRLRVRRGDLELDDVHVPGTLAGFTASASRGQIVAVVGAPGSGAGMVLEAVARLVDPVAGTLRVDGQDVMATAPWSAGTQIGYYRADLLLMRGTVARNLSYAMPDADPAEIQRIVLFLGLDDLLARLGPQGTKAWVTEGGRNLAPHDRNLVAFARALMGNPRVLLLDDPLSGLHPDDREAARNLIVRHRGTVLWHTSEPDDLVLADQVWFVEDGRLARSCTGSQYAQERWEHNRKGLVWASAQS
ncbi:MAG: ABC transporter ATP-binding protein/permease, partial [Micrococcales bacterium]|nr:ABC transporter ATP-binding protein/permease [Micrococcales bacterium]